MPYQENYSVAAPAHPLDVLLVEDQPDIAASLSALLRLWGYVVRVAVDGLAALEAVGQQLPDVVLLDIGLPLLDGWEVARRIRSEFGTGPLLIALTACDAAEDVSRSHRAGFHLHLTKPADTPMLRALLARVPFDTKV
jgi:CheY-like chemotaxis protein